MSIVGIDIGGTFTDLVGYQDGAIITSKCLTVPADPTEGACEALRIAQCDVAGMDELLHGSTIAINTVLEKSGAKTALITTAGFRDVYAIGRGNRPDAFNLFFHRPRPLVARDHVDVLHEDPPGLRVGLDDAAALAAVLALHHLHGVALADFQRLAHFTVPLVLARRSS